MVALKKNHRTGQYCVRVPIAGTDRQKWIPTGERSRARAERIIEQTGIDRLTLLAKAGALTRDAISIVTTGRKFTCRDVVDQWAAQSAERLAPETVKTYLGWIECLFDDIRCWREPIGWVKRHHLDSFVNDGTSKRTTSGSKLAALKSLYDYANAMALCIGNLADTVFVRHRDMTHQQKESRVILPLDQDEYDVLACSPTLPLFWKRAIALGYYAGLRISDVAALEWASLSTDGVKVWTRKRDKKVVLPFSNRLISPLAPVIREMLTEPRCDERFCFPTQNAVLLSKTRQRLSQDFTRWCDRHSICFKVFHSARHAFATRLDQAGVTVEEIGKLIGHSSARTTEGYIHR